MKALSIAALLCTIFLSFTFQSKLEHSKPLVIAGKYGVSSYSDAGMASISVELNLNEDHTFRFIDNSSVENKIDVTGKWTLYEGDIYLTDYPVGIKIHKIWKPESDCSCLKSRKGTAYYRLCKL